jgi:hypothetical protein
MLAKAMPISLELSLASGGASRGGKNKACSSRLAVISQPFAVQLPLKSLALYKQDLDAVSTQQLYQGTADFCRSPVDQYDSNFVAEMSGETTNRFLHKIMISAI